MTSDELLQIFEENENEYGEDRNLLKGLNYLNNLIPSNYLIDGADHDVVYLNVNLDDLAEVATKEDIVQLLRYGIIWSDEYDCLYLNV